MIAASAKAETRLRFDDLSFFFIAIDEPHEIQPLSAFFVDVSIVYYLDNHRR
jgi:hypothetical protein